MPVERTVRTSVDVEVPVRTAYDAWRHVEAFPRFMTGVASVHRHGRDGLRVVLAVAGRRRELDGRVVERSRDRAAAWTATDRTGHELRVRATFAPLDAGWTRLDVEVTWQPDGVGERAASLSGIDQRLLDHAVGQFRTHAESP